MHGNVAIAAVAMMQRRLRPTKVVRGELRAATFACSVTYVVLVYVLFAPAAAAAVPAAAAPDTVSFTLVALGDTQYYSSYFRDLLYEMTAWVAECAPPDALNTAFVTHLGDIVNRGNRFPSDWACAAHAMSMIAAAGVPHGFLPGNHDEDKTRPDGDRFYEYRAAFPLHRYDRYAWFGGSFGGRDTRNTYQLWEVGAHRFVSVHLEHLPRGDVVRWASGVLHAHRDRIGTLSTHYAGTDCSDEQLGGGPLANISSMFAGVDPVHPAMRALATEHCNVRLVFGGHVFGCGGERATAVTNRCNGTAHVLVSNYQDRGRGGDGWLRYYHFTLPRDPAHGGGEVCAYTYAPRLRRFERDADSHFSIDLASGTMRPGCTHALAECGSRYVPPAFVLASVWIASADVMFIYLLVVLLTASAVPPASSVAHLS